MTALEALRAAIVSETERAFETDPIPGAILDMCREREGKPVTKRDTARLEAAWPGLRVVIKKDYNLGWVEIEWYQNGIYDRTNKTLEDPSDWTDPERVARQRQAMALAELGVPGWSNRHRVYVRRGSYDGATRGGATRWPTPYSLKEWNRWCYDARDERNIEREQVLEAVRESGTVLASIARCVDELELLYQELQGHVATLPKVARERVAEKCESILTERGETRRRVMAGEGDDS